MHRIVRDSSKKAQPVFRSPIDVSKSIRSNISPFGIIRVIFLAFFLLGAAVLLHIKFGGSVSPSSSSTPPEVVSSGGDAVQPSQDRHDSNDQATTSFSPVGGSWQLSDDSSSSGKQEAPVLTPREIRLAQNMKKVLEAEGMSSLASADMQDRTGYDVLWPLGGPSADELKLRHLEDPPLEGKYHVVVYGGTNSSLKWQILTNYQSYLKVKAANPDGPMGDYTRLLPGDFDNLIHIVPTIVTKAAEFRFNQDPNTDMPRQKAWAISQWLVNVQIQEEYIFVVAPDHIFLSQPPLLATPWKIAAYPSGSVNCLDVSAKPYCIEPEFNPSGVEPDEIPRILSAPVMMTKSMLAKVAPFWDANSRSLYKDPVAAQTLKDVSSYALSLAIATATGGDSGVAYHKELLVEPYNGGRDLSVDTCDTIKFQAECPDGVRGQFSTQQALMVSYAHFFSFSKTGDAITTKGIFYFDQNEHVKYFPPTPLAMPPAGASQSAEAVIRSINEASAANGLWDAYVNPDVPPSNVPAPLNDVQLQAKANQQAKSDAAAMSLAAAKLAQAFVLPIELKPPGGPLETLVLAPTEPTPSSAGKYHVVIATDNLIYSRWQALASFATYRKAKRADPNGAMGGYTRLLAMGFSDDLMHIIPSIVIDNLPPRIDPDVKYRPMRRAWALSQWLSLVSIPESYILVCDPDYLYIDHMPLHASTSRAVVWPFWFLNCADEKMRPHCMNPLYNPKQIPPEEIPRAGPAPFQVHKDSLALLLPLWDRNTRALNNDQEASTAMNWAVDSYAFALALATIQSDIGTLVYHAEMMVQPPFNTDMRVDTCQGLDKLPRQAECQQENGVTLPSSFRDAPILHYTFPQDMDPNGVPVFGKVGAFHWNKMDHRRFFPKVPIAEPPAGSPIATIEVIRRINQVGAGSPIWRAYMDPNEPPAQATQVKTAIPEARTEHVRRRRRHFRSTKAYSNEQQPSGRGLAGLDRNESGDGNGNAGRGLQSTSQKDENWGSNSLAATFPNTQHALHVEVRTPGNA